jgi:hypothetical protein
LAALLRDLTDELHAQFGHFSRPSPRQGVIAHENDLASHAFLAEQLVRKLRLGKRKFPGNQRLDFLLLQKAQQGDQVLSEHCRFQALEPLDAVGDHPLPAREKPAASNVQTENRESLKAITAPGTT